MSAIPAMPRFTFAFAAKGWPRSIPPILENQRQRVDLATPLQLLLGVQEAATNIWSFDLKLIVNADPKPAGEMAWAVGERRA